MQPAAWLIMLTASGIGVAALVLGSVIVRSRVYRTTGPLGSCLASGLLVGIAFSVVLPDAISELQEVSAWSTRQTLLLFVGSTMAAFVLDHCVLTHEHLPPEAVPRPSDAVQMNCIGADAPPMGCQPCEASPVSRGASAACQCDAPPYDFVAQLQRHRQPKRDWGGLGTVTIADPSRDAGDSKLLSSTPSPPLCSSLPRLVAWLVHSCLDGMVLGSCTSQVVLAPLAVAILLCTVQDVAAFCLSLREYSSKTKSLALGVFAATIPCGAGIALQLVDSTRGQREALDIFRVCVAGIFVHMALFEMSPPHSHRRSTNLCYVVCFSLGLASASAAGLLEAWSENSARFLVEE